MDKAEVFQTLKSNAEVKTSMTDYWCGNNGQSLGESEIVKAISDIFKIAVKNHTKAFKYLFEYLKDGHVRMTEDIVKELNRKSYLKKKVVEVESELDKCHNALSEIIDSGVQLDEHESTDCKVYSVGKTNDL